MIFNREIRENSAKQRETFRDFHVQNPPKIIKMSSTKFLNFS
jgi:hypothetical protein